MGQVNGGKNMRKILFLILLSLLIVGCAQLEVFTSSEVEEEEVIDDGLDEAISELEMLEDITTESSVP